MRRNLTRRSFLARSLASFASGPLITRQALGALSSAALDSAGTDYKAIVQVSLFGGNDTNNVLVPLSSTDYATYASVRGPLALAASSLLPLSQANYGLHPSLINVAALFNQSKAAFVANVGPLIAPVTITQARAQQMLPGNLLSHPDQQNLFQTLGTATNQPDGAGGHLADLMSSLGPAIIPLATSVTGSSVPFIQGRTTAGFIAPVSGLTLECARNVHCQTRAVAAQEIASISSASILVQHEQLLSQQSFQYSVAYQDALQQARTLLTPLPPNNGLATQFHQIAGMMSARTAFGGTRQIFSAGMGGFDTHDNQLSIQAALLSTLDQAIGYAMDVMEELGLTNQVVFVFDTDFARQLVPGATLGSDHAFGHHMLVLGGPVQGGFIYGDFPQLALGGPNDYTGDGRLLPTTSTISRNTPDPNATRCRAACLGYRTRQRCPPLVVLTYLDLQSPGFEITMRALPWNQIPCSDLL